MIAIMQPYFLPFIGYFQLIDAVDTFVLYDDAQFTKKGYMTTNRLFLNGSEQPFSLNVRDKKKIDIIRNKTIAVEEFGKACRRQKSNLAKLPFFDAALFDALLTPKSDNLFDYLFTQIQMVCEELDISTKIVRSSDLTDTGHLVGKDKIVALCDAADDHVYLNSSGGKDLYNKETMAEDGIELKWLTYKPSMGDLAAPYSILQTIFELPREDVKKIVEQHMID